MKLALISGMAVIAFVTEGAIAACTAPAVQVENAALTTLLSNNTICASNGGESWQEEHQGVGSGDLWDYKLGDGHPVDPRKQLGSWSVDETTSEVTYTYDGGLEYTYSVWDDGGTPNTYSFCVGGVASIENATIEPGINVGCPGAIVP